MTIAPVASTAVYVMADGQPASGEPVQWTTVPPGPGHTGWCSHHYQDPVQAVCESVVGFVPPVRPGGSDGFSVRISRLSDYETSTVDENVVVFDLDTGEPIIAATLDQLDALVVLLQRVQQLAERGARL